MPGIARQFEPQITRTGGAPSRYRLLPDAPGVPRQTAMRPASLPVMSSSKVTLRTAAGFSDAIGPMIYVRLA